MKKIFLLLMFLVSFLFSFEELNNKNFNEKISKGNVIVTFHATWCSICKESFENLHKYENETDIKIYKVDIGEEIELTKRFDAMTIPLFVYFKDGKLIARDDGLKSTDQIKDSIERYFN